MDKRSDETCRHKTNLPLRFIMGLVAKLFPDVPLISTRELDELLNDLKENNAGPEDEGSNVILLDIREVPEFKESRISGAELIVFSESYSKQFRDAVTAMKKKISQRKNTNENFHVYVYCAVGARASMFAHGFQKYLKRMQMQEGSSVDPEDQRAAGDDTLPFSCLDMRVVQGSIYKWAMEDRPLVDSSGNNTSTVHQCSVLWGKIFLKKQYRHKGPCPLIL